MPMNLPNNLNVVVKQSYFPYLVGLLLVFAAYMFGSCGKKSALDVWKQKYNDYRDSTKIVLQQSDSLRAQSNLLVDSAQKIIHNASHNTKIMDSLKHENAKLQTINDSLYSVAQSDSTVSPNAKKIINSLHQENVSLRQELGLVTLDDSANARAARLFYAAYQSDSTRAEKLQRQLDALPTGPPSEKLLGLIPLPSRQASFFAGAVTVIVAHTLVNIIQTKRVL